MELITRFVRDFVQQVLPAELASLVMASEWMIWIVVAIVASIAVWTAISTIQGSD